METKYENEKLKEMIMYWRKRCEEIAEDRMRLTYENQVLREMIVNICKEVYGEPH